MVISVLPQTMRKWNYKTHNKCLLLLVDFGNHPNEVLFQKSHGANLVDVIIRLIPQVLAWHFKRKYKIELKVGRIVLRKVILKDVTIAKNGYSIHIEDISIRSSLFNSDVAKLISIGIRDVRINKDVVEERGGGAVGGGKLKKSSSTKQIDTMGGEPGKLGSLQAEVQKLVDFRDMKIPSGVMLFAQFLSVKVHNLSVMVLGDGGSGGWLWHCVVGKGGAGGGAAGGGGPGLHLGLVAHDVRAKLLRRHPHPHPSHPQQTCLAEFSFSLNLDLSLLGDNTLNVEKVSCSITNPSATLNEGIYKFVYDQNNKKKLKAQVVVEVPQRRTAEGDSLFQRLAPVIPKNFSLKVNTTTLTGVRDNSRTDFCSSLQSLQINARFSASSAANSMEDMPLGLQSDGADSKLPQVYLAFQMDQFKINSNKEKLMFLNKLKLDAKLEREVLNLYLIVNTLTLSYNHDDVFKWCCSSFPLKDLDLVSDSIHLDSKQIEVRNSVPSWIEEVCGACVIQGCAELWGLTLGVQRGGHHATLACSGLKVKLDQLNDLRGSPYKATLPRLILGMRHWSTELLVDSAWLQVGSGDIPLKRHHSWGTGLFVGVALLKWGSHAHQTTKLEAMLDCLRAEWGPEVARTLLLLLDCYTDYRKYKSIAKQKPQTSKTENKMSVTMTLTNVNMFTLADNDICLMTRVDAISVDKNNGKLNLVISGFKMADVVPYKGNYICQRAEEMATMFCYIKLMRCEFHDNVSDVQLLEVVEGQWSPNLHLKCLSIVKDLKMFKEDFKAAFSSRAVAEEVDVGPSIEKQWCVAFKGDVAVRLVLSQKHNLLFSFDELTLSRGPAGFSLSWGFGHLAIDDMEIFSVEGVTLDRIQDSPKIREERQNAEGFTLPWNKTWGVTIVSFRAVFPYEHNFAEAVQDEFISVTKWIKIIHNYKKKEFKASSPLPSDLYIKVEEFILELSDDPFEVKLRDNYELLEDEYKESLKRKTMLDAKVAELCKPHLFLPAGKVEELYAGLSRRNAQIYVQRSKQLAAGAAPRPLLCCRLLNTRILALADPTLHGTQRCISHLKQLDPDSSWGEEGMEFSTLWCRWVVGWCGEWRLQLRDFPQPLLLATDWQMWGRVMGAEQVPPPRARRLSGVEQGAPWGVMQIERSMTSLKFYYDLNWEMDHYTYAFGPCWEPVIAQCNISWDQVLRGSRDPSVALPWWDKVRLLMHGRLTLCVRRLALLLHASLDPYNTTEEMELAWTDLAVDWTNAKIVFKGDLNVYVRTASKYDDCRLLHLPNLRLTLKLSWLCLADPNDHHSVVQCAPDKIPEYSSNQEHDSFRAFRSQGVGVHLAFETRPSDEIDCPVLLLYGSTLRWFESLKQILSGATRPTRRGPLFNNTKPRRPQFSRHIRTARLSLALHRFQVCYWMSFAMQRGVEVCGRRVTCGAQHTLSLAPSRDGLKRRPRANWQPLYINCELNDAEVWLKSALHYDPDKESMSIGQPVEKCYCLSVGKVSYGREAGAGAGSGGGPAPGVGGAGEAPPTHRLVVHDLRAAWTKTNRDVAFALFDTYMKNKQLKKNLSTEALKIFRNEETESNMQNGRGPEPNTPATPPTNPVQAGAGQTQALLAQLVAEAEHKAVVFSDDLSESNTQPPPHAVTAANDDSSMCNWLIALVNAQVVLRGCETRGYVVLCAARAEVRQRIRRGRCTWSGSLQSMQYYATVSARDNEQLHQNIQWVCVEEIEDKGNRAISALPDVPRLVGSGHSAGGVLGSTVGPSADQADAPQLQRIVSRCTCEFYYVSYEDTAGVGDGPGGSVWEEPDIPCDSFTLMHHDLDVCTNSLQYAMLLDVVNNLVLYVEPQRKRALERMARMRFQLQLHRVPDPRRPIQLLQNQVRGLVAQLRRLEKETYLVQRALAEGADQQMELQELQKQIILCKDQLNSDGEELHAMVSCYQESRSSSVPATAARPAAPVKVNEICFKHAQWRLTDADGQLGIADLVLTNFQYTKNTKSDDSVEHLLELGYVRMTNLLPNEPYSEVLLPSEVRTHMPVARQRVLRVFCREKPPVGGISVKEHFEINVVPITIGLTKKFYNTMLKFCFPERDPETIDMERGEGGEEEDLTGGGGGTLSKQDKDKGKTKAKGKKNHKDSNFYVKIDQKDDVEKMKERAEKNKLFIYIKIPEVPVRVSYKGNKEKNLEDLRDISIVIPTLEYHNVTWTWLDLLLAMKVDSRRVILSQAIRQKLNLHRGRQGAGAGGAVATPPEEDKARMLLGDRRPGETKPHKKGVPGAFKK